MRAPLPENERERLAALRAFDILGAVPEQSYDDITLLASEICGTPISAISLIDEHRQWFKSIVGLDVTETHRDMTFCAPAILDPDQLLVVPDATKDARFTDNLLVTKDPQIRFYAGMPLVTFSGDAVGTLCVIGRTPRELSENKLKALRVLARQVVYQLELRRALGELRGTVSQLNEAEIELRSEQCPQLELRDRLVSPASHELRSPLTVVYQYVTILLDGLAGSLSPEQREYLEIVLKNALQLQGMIGDLLDTTRVRAGKLRLDRRRVELGEVVTEVVGSLGVVASEKGHILTAEGVGSAPEVIADAGRIRQVIVNLVENALKFTPRGGRITVRVDAAEDAVGAARVSVEDTGCGIPAADHERIFEQLYQIESERNANRQGLGLGLAICRELVSRHGGRLWVESEPGKGSTFRFTVPTFDLVRLLAPLGEDSGQAKSA